MIESTEIWVPIVGFIGAYSVSNLGRVRAETRTVDGDRGYRRTFDGREMKPLPNGNGYFSVCLWTGNKAQRKYIHRLVAEHFIPNPSCRQEVNHKNGNKADNRAGNLEWVSRVQNQSHAWDTGLAPHGERCKFSVLKEQDVVRIYFGNESAKELAKEYGICQGNIWKIRNKLRWRRVIEKHERLRAEAKMVGGSGVSQGAA